MSDYHGNAELLKEDGTVISEVVVYLQKTEATATTLGEWDGMVDPTDIIYPIEDAKTLRLPDGSEGNIIVSNVKREVRGTYGTSQRATLVGSGPAPF